MTQWNARGLAALAVLTPCLAAAQGVDPLARLPLEAAAVLNPGPEAVLLLIETDHDVKASRMLRIGDEYAAGWRLTALVPGLATLTREGQSRTFALQGQRALAAPPPAIAVQPASPPVSAGPLASTILPPTRRTIANAAPATRVTNTAAMQAAIARGDVAAVMALDGSAVDYMAAWAAKNDATGVNMYNADNTDWTSARFVSRGGRLYVAVNVADVRGRRMTSVLEFHATEFDSNPAFRPNWPIELQGQPTLDLAGAVQINGAPLSSAPRPPLEVSAIPTLNLGSLSIANGFAATATGN